MIYINPHPHIIHPLFRWCFVGCMEIQIRSSNVRSSDIQHVPHSVAYTTLITEINVKRSNMKILRCPP